MTDGDGRVVCQMVLCLLRMAHWGFVGGHAISVGYTVVRMVN